MEPSTPAPVSVPPPGPLCGLWLNDATGQVHAAVATPSGGRAEAVFPLVPFAWATHPPRTGRFSEVTAPVPAAVAGAPAPAFPHVLEFPDLAALQELDKDDDSGTELLIVKPLEHQFLLERGWRLFDRLPFGGLRRLQLDIETHCARPGGFSDAREPEDRILAIGLWSSTEAAPRLLELAELTDAAEKRLLEDFLAALGELDPDIIEGHNIFNFDLDYLWRRSKRLKVPARWGRWGQPATTRNSRLRVAERQLQFTRFDLPGRAVFDTYLAAQLYDVSTRELPSYGLKDVAVYFGVTPEDSEERTYLRGAEIQNAFAEDRASFRAYLSDDLRETRGIANLLLPTYVAQAKTFPATLTEVCLRGTGAKVDWLLLERYHAARAPLPKESEVGGYEGGFSRSFATGVFHRVLHFDVASLYPSLLLHLARNPQGDSIGAFLPLLKELRTYRLRYKALAKSAPSAEERAEAQARQTAFKIVINSFYGYLGFNGARFADGALAAEVTRLGRELLQALMEAFRAHGCAVLEADTDGIYVATDAVPGGPAPTPLSASAWDDPESLLAAVATVLPAGIELEFDGRYPSMFCYKAKNYALYDGQRVIIKGSALRSRGVEPYLKRLTHHLIHHALGVPGAERPPAELLREVRFAVAGRTLDVRQLAKAEYLSMSPEAYRKFIDGGGKPRRAALEVALTLQPPPRQGERVSYYLAPKQKGATSDWQRARPLAAFDPGAAPYDPTYYLKRLEEWEERWAPFLRGDAPVLHAGAEAAEGDQD